MNVDTKANVYKCIVDITKKTGQGLSGIVKVKSLEIANWIDELIEEGLVEGCHTGGSLGHPESNIFYIPTKGYNLWKDDGTDGVYIQHKGRYLTEIRYYLGILKEEDDYEKDDVKNFTSPSMTRLGRNPKFMKSYAEWLDRNHKELEIMLNLDDYYDEPEIKFTEKEIEWLKSRNWFKENQTIKECYEASKNANSQKSPLQKQLLTLYKSDTSGKYAKEQEALEKEMEEDKNNEYTRKKVHKWFDTQKLTSKIQTAFKKIK